MGQPAVKTQPGSKRVKNFDEVSLGYSKKLAAEEAKRCPQCENPVCIDGCPLGIHIPGFIRALREGKANEAYAIIREKNWLPSVCGRLCAAPCEAACVLMEEEAPIGIRALERFAADHGRSKLPRRRNVVKGGKKVAIIGSGPAGLTAAYELNRSGYQVTVFEAMDKPGGVLRYGIPEFRLPKKIIDLEIKELEALGVELKTSVLVGHTLSLEEIQREYLAVLLTTGASIPKFIDIPGTSLRGVYYGEEFLMRVNRAKNARISGDIPRLPLGKKLAVIGSGNTALDCARIGARLGLESTLVFRRTEEDIHVTALERSYAKEEGVLFEPMTKPVEILAGPDGGVRGLKCVQMDFADPDNTGEWKLMPLPNSEHDLLADTVVIAIGHNPNSLVHKQVSALKLNADGTIATEDLSAKTSLPGVFAAGNVKTNAGPVVEAILSGKKAAQEIDEYLK